MDQDENTHPMSSSSQHQQLQLDEFNDLVATILMNAEELRRSLTETPTTDDVMQWRDRLEHLLSLTDPLARWTQDAVGSPLETDMFRHCQDKIQLVGRQALQAAIKLKEPDPDDPYLVDPIHVVRTNGQAAMARLAELNLILLQTTTSMTNLPATSRTAPDTELSQKDVADSYVAYQRQVLRQRAKPGIARLVQARRDGLFQLPHDRNIQIHDDVDDDDETTKVSVQQYHAPVLADILGQAAALIHPLLMWLIHLPKDGDRDELQQSIAQLCIESIQTVNAQAQELVQTISKWFWEDRPMEEWMARTTTTDDAPLDQTQLAILDGLVEEIAFTCQVQARYNGLFNDAATPLPFTLNATTLQDELLPEYTWKYASLERYLAVQQWHSAVSLAVPVLIVMGTNIYVPSVVEDAQYLSTRALERAALTESAQAIGTVAHAISHDVWSMEEGGVFSALQQERGCWIELKSATEEMPQLDTVSSPPRSGFESGFVSALMDALDEEEPPLPPARDNGNGAKDSRAPNSGNFLLSIVGSSEQLQQSRMDADLCTLNGFHAACGACTALVAFLDTLLPSVAEDKGRTTARASDNKSEAMIRLAREELTEYAAAYQCVLDERIRTCLSHWCGSIDDQGANWEGKLLPQLRIFFEVEEYMLHEDAFEKAEKDERLNTELTAMLEESKYLCQLSDKCDGEVLCQIGIAVVTSFVELILNVLWSNGKLFTDWGALLLSKEVRLIQRFCSKIMYPTSSDAPAPNLLACWERLSQVACILQLEKPADWLTYSSILSPNEVQATLRLRADFSPDAIQAVVSQLSNT